MRKIIWLLPATALALTLGGCNGGGSSSQEQAGASSQSAAAPAAPVANKVTGTVSLQDSVQLSPDAKLVIDLVDASSAPDASAPPLATKTVSPATQFPLDFSLDVNPTEINANDLYVIKASMTDGERQFSMALQAPVLTKGAKNQVNIQLVAKQTPGEKDLADFEALKKQIGGMKIKQGTKLDKELSRGWQIFRKDGQVQFIVEQVDYVKGGFNLTDFAYKNGKPFVAVQQQKSDKDAKPTVTEKASWDGEGKAVLLQSVASGDKISKLGDDEAAKLHKQAEFILDLATGGKGK